MFLLIPIAMFGQDAVIEPIITDRPDLTESPNAVPFKSVQIETGMSFSRTNQINGVIDDISYNGTLLRIGAARNFEVRIGASFDQVRTDFSESSEEKVAGISPLDIGFKSQINEGEGVVPTVGILGNLTLPTGPFNESYVVPQMMVSLGHDLHETVSLGYNFGMSWPVDVPNVELFYSLALGLAPHERFGFFAEIYGDVLIKGHEEGYFAYDGGITFLIRPHMQLDLSAGGKIDGSIPDWFVSLGFSVRLPKNLAN